MRHVRLAKDRWLIRLRSPSHPTSMYPHINISTYLHAHISTYPQKSYVICDVLRITNGDMQTCERVRGWLATTSTTWHVARGTWHVAAADEDDDEGEEDSDDDSG